MPDPVKTVENVADEAARKAAAETGAAVVNEVQKTKSEAEVTVTAAEAAVALASSAAAASAMDAAERERGLVERVNKWQTEQTEQMKGLQTRMAEMGSAVSAIVSALSSAPKPSTPQKSEAEAAGTVVVKPAEVKTVEGGEAPTSNRENGGDKPARRKRRFI